MSRMSELDLMLREAERTGELTDELRKIARDVHFCPSWEGMIVYKDGPGSDSCECSWSMDLYIKFLTLLWRFFLEGQSAIDYYTFAIRKPNPWYKGER